MNFFVKFIKVLFRVVMQYTYIVSLLAITWNFFSSLKIRQNAFLMPFCHFIKTKLTFQQFQEIFRVLWLHCNKTGTSQVGAVSKAQKAQNIFFGKNLKFSKKKFFRKMSHSAEKCKRGTLFDL